MPSDSTKLTFSQDSSRIGLAELAALYGAVGFGCAENYLSNPEAEYLAKVFGPGVYGFFAHSDDALIGMARVFSDDAICSWIAELCVHPDWQRRGVARSLVEMVNRRFPHTALYGEAFSNQVDFFWKVGMSPKPVLVACSRAPIKDSNR